MNADELKTRVDAIQRFHQIDLGNGLVTPGTDFTFDKIKRLKLPPLMEGKTVIDIGAWDGALSCQAKKSVARMRCAPRRSHSNGSPKRFPERKISSLRNR